MRLGGLAGDDRVRSGVHRFVGLFGPQIGDLRFHVDDRIRSGGRLIRRGRRPERRDAGPVVLAAAAARILREYVDRGFGVIIAGYRYLRRVGDAHGRTTLWQTGTGDREPRRFTLWQARHRHQRARRLLLGGAGQRGYDLRFDGPLVRIGRIERRRDQRAGQVHARGDAGLLRHGRGAAQAHRDGMPLGEAADDEKAHAAGSFDGHLTTGGQPVVGELQVLGDMPRPRSVISIR